MDQRLSQNSLAKPTRNTIRTGIVILAFTQVIFQRTFPICTNAVIFQPCLHLPFPDILLGSKRSRWISYRGIYEWRQEGVSEGKSLVLRWVILLVLDRGKKPVACCVVSILPNTMFHCRLDRPDRLKNIVLRVPPLIDPANLPNSDDSRWQLEY